MNNSPTAHIIFDVPSKTDAFDGQGHDRSAKALAEGIDQVFENGGGAIGLEGAWGSGKSSVIEMAEGRLDEVAGKVGSSSIKYHVFAFDLWTHQTDEFRRAFLERFLDFMSRAEFENRVDIEGQRDKIRNRKKEVTNESKHRYTPAGAAIVLLLPFLPLVYAWLQPTAFASEKVQLVAQILGVVALASFLIGLTMIRDRYLLLPIEVRSGLKTFPQKFARGASEFLTLTKKIDQETSVQWIRDEDPTTVEFQKTFRDILSKAQSRTNRIVFVLDNIDRLSGEAVKNAWSEMRSLLSGKQDQTPLGELPQPVVVVVPYDREIITQALAENQEDTDLFAKTFHRILRVSPPLGSHWVGFMEKMIEKAFSKQHDEASIYRLYRLLQFHLQVKNKPATPRRIVSFVNDIGSYWTQWGGILPVESMAVFVLLRNEIEIYFVKLGEPAFDLVSYTKISRQDDLLRHLAALHFNVPPAEAEEILLAAPLTRALSASKSTDLERVRQVAGFEKFFSRLLPECLKDRADDPDILAQVAINIAELKLEGPLADDIAIQMSDYIPALKSFDLKEPGKVRKGLNTIVAMQSPANVVKTARAVKRRIEEIQADDDNTTGYDKGIQWGRYVTDLGDEILVKISAEEAQKFWKFALPLADAEFGLGLAYLVEEDPNFRYLSLENAPLPADLLPPLEVTIPQGGRIVADVAKEIGRAFKADARTSLLNAISAHLKSAVIVAEEADHYLMACARIISLGMPDKALTAATQKLVVDGTVLYYTFKSENPGSLGAGLFTLIKQYGVASAASATDPHPVLGSLTEATQWYVKAISTGDVDEQTVAQSAQFVADDRMFGVWLGYAASQPSGSFFDKVIRQMIATGRLGVVAKVAANALIDSYFQLKEIFGSETMGRLVGAMGVALTDDTAIPDEMLLKLPSDLVDNVEAWSPGSVLGKTVPRIDALLKSITADEWEEALSTGGPEVQMLLVRIEKAGLKLSAKEYLDGYKRSALNVIAGEHDVTFEAEAWNRLYQAIPNSSRKVLARGIMTDLMRKGVKPGGAAEFIVNYADLAASLPLEDYADATVQIMLRELVLSEHDAVKNYIRDSKNKLKKVIASLSANESSSSANDGLAALEDAVSSLEQTDNEAAWASEFRALVNLPKKEIPEPEPAPDEDEDEDDSLNQQN